MTHIEPHDDIRRYINLVESAQNHIDEAMPVGLGQRLKTGLQTMNPFSAEKRSQAGGQAVAQKSTNQYYAYLVKVMGSQNLSWDTLTWKQMANFLAMPNGLAMTPEDLDQVETKLKSGPMGAAITGTVNFDAQTPLGNDAQTSQKIAQELIQSAVATYLARGNLGGNPASTGGPPGGPPPGGGPAPLTAAERAQIIQQLNAILASL